jgi:hypothetical protein
MALGAVLLLSMTVSTYAAVNSDDTGGGGGGGTNPPPAKVPDTGATALLLGTSMVGLTVMRLRNRR